MKEILILYPKEFSCSEKFNRKVENITKNISLFKITSLHDEKSLIKNLSKKNNFVFNIREEIDDITHAIIFDDGESFINELYSLKEKKIPIRIIKVKITKVINIKNTKHSKNNTENYEYIGRGSKWGNPYSIYENGDDRDEVIRKFKYDFYHDKFLNIKKTDFLILRGKTLGCFCKPLSCHGDVIADYLNSLDDGE